MAFSFWFAFKVWLVSISCVIRWLWIVVDLHCWLDSLGWVCVQWNCVLFSLLLMYFAFGWVDFSYVVWDGFALDFGG